jgi:hypothetical protein
VTETGPLPGAAKKKEFKIALKSAIINELKSALHLKVTVLGFSFKIFCL